MGADENLDVIRRLHAERPYSRALLGSGLLAPDAEWWAVGDPAVLPWAGTWRGPDGVARFFETLNAHMDYERFETREYVAGGDAVVAYVSAAGKAVATGRPFASEIVRTYGFRDGRIARVRNHYDSLSYARALGRA